MARSTFSHSRLSAFETCPRKYFFRYIEGLESKDETIEAFVGKQVHGVLEWLHTEVQAKRVPALDAVLARFRADWDRGHAEAKANGIVIRIVREGDTADSYRALGERCLSGYHARYAPFDAVEVVGVEMRLDAPLDEAGTHWMTGIADRVSRVRDGVYEIRDYKTGRWVPSQAELDQDRQLALYQYALHRLFPDAREVHLVWNYLRHDRELRSRRTPQALEKLRADTLALVLRVLERHAAVEHRRDDVAAVDAAFPTVTSRLCDWCEWKPICPAWGAPPDAARKAAIKPGFLFPT